MQQAVWTNDGVTFQVGDVVRVVRMVESFDPNGMGSGKKWDNTWAGSCLNQAGMDGYFGLEFTISDINEQGVFFEIPENLEGTEYTIGGYGFPLKALEIVRKRGEQPLGNFAARIAYFEKHISAIEDKINELLTPNKEAA